MQYNQSPDKQQELVAEFFLQQSWENLSRLDALGAPQSIVKWMGTWGIGTSLESTARGIGFECLSVKTLELIVELLLLQ